MNKHTAVLPDGNIARRNSQNRTYSHMVAVFSAAWNETEPSWGAVSWHSTLPLARKAAASIHSWPQPPVRVVILPTTITKSGAHR